MKKLLIIFILAAIVLFIGGAVEFFNSRPERNQLQEELKVFKIGDAIFQVEIADTIEKHTLGLSGQSGLEKGRGMLFIFNQPTVPRFWMKGMKFPLDIVWIGGGKVIGLEENLPPDNTPSPKIYSPSKPVNMVLEINAGASTESGISVGDKVALEIRK